LFNTFDCFLYDKLPYHTYTIKLRCKNAVAKNHVDAEPTCTLYPLHPLHTRISTLQPALECFLRRSVAVWHTACKLTPDPRGLAHRSVKRLVAMLSSFPLTRRARPGLVRALHAARWGRRSHVCEAQSGRVTRPRNGTGWPTASRTSLVAPRLSLRHVQAHPSPLGGQYYFDP
jgi:hypothetical protein